MKANAETSRTRPCRRHQRHQIDELPRESGLGQSPGHCRGRADDEKNRPGQRSGLDQDRIDALPVELTIDEDADDDRIDDADGGDLGRGRDPFDDGGADDDRQAEAGNGDERAASPSARA